MKTKSEYIFLIQSFIDQFISEFGVRTLRIFGSVARNEQTPSSDVDICVETESANPFFLMDMKEYLERLTESAVDIVRFRKDMDSFLKQRIEKEGIYVLR